MNMIEKKENILQDYKEYKVFQNPFYCMNLSSPWSVSKVWIFSPEAKRYFDIIRKTPWLMTSWSFSITLLKILASLPSSEIFIFRNETQKVVWGILLSHISTTMYQWENITSLNRMNTFSGLHISWYKYASYLVVDEAERWKWYAELLWSIKERFYLFLLDANKEEKIKRMWWEPVIDNRWKPLCTLSTIKSQYFKVDNY